MHALTLCPLARRVALAALMIAVVTSPAWPQNGEIPTPESLGIVPGARVRLIASEDGENPQTGTVIAVRGDGIVFRREAVGDSQIVGFAHMGRLDVSRGRHARPLAGLGLGFVGGAVAGAAIGLATYQKASCNGQGFGCGVGDLGSGGNAAGGAILGGVGGAVLGLIAGSFIHTEQWRTVSLNPLLAHTQTGIAVIPSQSGPRVVLRVAARF